MTQTAASAQTLHVNGVDLTWSERGSSPVGTPTLVLCHGFTGSSHDFALEVDALAADRRVVTLDQRGHGHSTKTGQLDGYTIEQLVGRPDGLPRGGRGGAGRPARPLHGRSGRHGRGPGPPRPGALTDPHGHRARGRSSRPTRRSAPWSTASSTRSTRPAACRRPSAWVAPRTPSSRRATPAEWRSEKDAIFAGMDAYAVKALGSELMGDAAEDDGSLRASLPAIACPTTVIVGRARPPAGRPGAGAGRRGGRRPADRHPRGVPLAAADACRRVAGGRRGPPGVGGDRPGERSDRRHAAAGRRPDRARRHGRRHPAPRRGHVGLGRQGHLGHGRLRPVPDRVDHPRRLGGQHRGGCRPLRHGRGLRARRERAHHRPAARRPTRACATGSSSRRSSCRARGS